MDINEALNEIIFKYDLDKYYPHYRNMCIAEKVLKNLVKDIIQCGKKAVFVGDDPTGTELVRNMAGSYSDIHFLTVGISGQKELSLQEMEQMDWKLYDERYIIMFRGAEYIERWFRLHNIQYEWVYDIFEREGIVLQREFYAFGKEDLYFLNDSKGAMRRRGGWAESIQCELYCQKSKCDIARNSRIRQIALEKCFFLSLYMRNFELAHQYSAILAKSDGRFEVIWDEIRDLLDTIRRMIADRRQEDIVLYWLDSIPYCDVGSMPHLQELLKKSVVFENAFTYIPYTHPALRAMFLGKKDIDDQAYDIMEITNENSPVIQFLEGQGYSIRVFSGYFSDYFPISYRSRHFYTDVCAPFSMKLWDMLFEMLLTDQKTLCLVHSLESHAPYLNGRISDKNYKELGELRRLARLEIDEQLAFYDSFVSENAFRIYMSDHGDGTMLQRRIQVLFSICHKTLEPGVIKGLFSLLDFGPVLKKMLIEKKVEENDFSREYVEIGNLDLYNPRIMANLFQNREDINEIYFGYKGIVDQEYIYIRYMAGKEWLSHRRDLRNPILFYECADDVCNPELLSKYRELTGGYPEGMLADEKFRYSKYLYALYHD